MWIAYTNQINVLCDVRSPSFNLPMVEKSTSESRTCVSKPKGVSFWYHSNHKYLRLLLIAGCHSYWHRLSECVFERGIWFHVEQPNPVKDVKYTVHTGKHVNRALLIANFIQLAYPLIDHTRLCLSMGIFGEFIELSSTAVNLFFFFLFYECWLFRPTSLMLFAIPYIYSTTLSTSININISYMRGACKRYAAGIELQDRRRYVCHCLCRLGLNESSISNWLIDRRAVFCVLSTIDGLGNPFPCVFQSTDEDR